MTHLFLRGYNIHFSFFLNYSESKSKLINKTAETEANGARYGSFAVTFYNKKGVSVCSVLGQWKGIKNPIEGISDI